MKTLLLLALLILSLPAVSMEVSDETCLNPLSEILDKDTTKMLTDINTNIKKEFKSRPVTMPNYTLALSIDTNFTVPLLGNDTYFGRIYLKKNDSESIHYRDELITEDRYELEKNKPDSFFLSAYQVSDINSEAGLNLIKAAGTEVNLKSDGKFSTAKGGRLYLKVKASGEDPFNLTIDVEVINGKVSNYIHADGKRILFDNLIINADKNVFGNVSILAGIKDIQFQKSGKITHTLE